MPLLRRVGLDGRLNDAQGAPPPAGDVGQGLGVLGETGTAVAGAGMQKFGSDAPVLAHGSRHRLDVGAHRLAEVGDLVDEGNFNRQEGIGRVFDHLGGLEVGLDEGRLVEIEHAVDGAHRLARSVRFDAQHHSVRMHEVVDCRSLPEELGVRYDIEILSEPARSQLLTDPSPDKRTRADGHCALVHHRAIAVHGPPDGPGGFLDIAQVGGTIVGRGRSHGDEDHFRSFDRPEGVAREGEPLGRHVPGDHVGEARLEDGDLAGFEGFDFLFVDVDAGDGVAEVGEAGARDEAYIAGSNDGDRCHCASLIG